MVIHAKEKNKSNIRIKEEVMVMGYFNSNYYPLDESLVASIH